MPAPRRRITQDDASDPLANLRASEKPLPSWRPESGLDGRTLRHLADRPPQPAPIYLVKLARPRRDPPEPLRLTRHAAVFNVPDANIDQPPTRTPATKPIRRPSADAPSRTRRRTPRSQRCAAPPRIRPTSAPARDAGSPRTSPCRSSGPPVHPCPHPARVHRAPARSPPQLSILPRLAGQTDPRRPPCATLSPPRQEARWSSSPRADGHSKMTSLASPSTLARWHPAGPRRAPTAPSRLG